MIYKISEIATVVAGATPSTEIKENYDGDIYWITPKDLSNNKGKKYIRDCERKITKQGFQSCSTTMIPANNILISTRAPIGYIAINSMDCCTNQGFKSLVCNNKVVDVDYLYYYLNYKMKEIEALGSGTTFKEVSKNSIENFEIDVPNLEVQIKISKILAILDNQIERNTAMVKKLQVLGKVIFQKWFVQFKPFKNDNPNLIYNEKLGRLIPEMWSVFNIRDVIKWISSSQPPKNMFSSILKDGYIRFIQNRDYESDEHLTFIPLTKNTKICDKYDIMIDKYGDAGRVRYGIEGAFNVALAKIVPLLNNSQEYIRHFLMLPSTYEYLNNACIASTRASLNEQTLSGLYIPIPPNDLLLKFEKIQKKLIALTFDIEINTKELIKIKNSLLPLLINRQLV